MDKILSKEDLLFLKEDEVIKLRGKFVEIKKEDGTVINSEIQNIIGASNAPHLPCGFVLSNKKEICFGSIKEILITY